MLVNWNRNRWKRKQQSAPHGCCSPSPRNQEIKRIPSHYHNLRKQHQGIKGSVFTVCNQNSWQGTLSNPRSTSSLELHFPKVQSLYEGNICIKPYIPITAIDFTFIECERAYHAYRVYIFYQEGLKHNEESVSLIKMLLIGNSVIFQEFYLIHTSIRLKPCCSTIKRTNICYSSAMFSS